MAFAREQVRADGMKLTAPLKGVCPVNSRASVSDHQLVDVAARLQVRAISGASELIARIVAAPPWPRKSLPDRWTGDRSFRTA